MRVILTGFTSDTAKGTSVVGFESMSTGLERMLQTLGHEYRFKPMAIETNDDDLTWADVMIVGLAPVNGIGSRFCLGALDAIRKARMNNCGLVFYVTDWKTHMIQSGNRSITKNPHNLTKWHLRNRSDFAWGVHHNAELVRVVESFNNRPWPITLVPTHTWFDPSLAKAKKLEEKLTSRELVHMDPTAFTTRAWTVDRIAPEDKKREAVLAALGDYSKWMDEQNFTWPIRYFGGKTMDVRAPAIDSVTGEPAKKNTRIKETEVNKHYAETWIGITPKHSLSGSGWWRTRYDFILRSGSILYGEDSEIGVIGDAFRQPLSVIENMNTEQLHALAEAQREQFNARVEPHDSLLSKLEYALAKGRTDLGLSVGE